MARLYEYQGKELLKKFGINIPKGRVAKTPDEAKKIAEEIGKSVVIKAQVWTTKRAKIGGIQFADTANEAYDKAKNLLKIKVGKFTVEEVLVEEKLDIEREFYASIIIDDTAKKPLVMFSSIGGSGIEEIAKKYPDKVAMRHITLSKGLRDYYAREVVLKTGIKGKLAVAISNVLVNLWSVAKAYDARTAEINPLVLTKDGKIFAADCRITVDDYSVFRHPELGIEIAREFDHPPTELEKIAYNVEKDDYRGTFYFVQLAEDIDPKENYIGFHGAGGGGSMMSMDAASRKGYKLANFTDTSGNPSASKVYRAAKIILSQKGIVGYFGSGSGVASQEQTNSARGLVKAFREDNVKIPIVIRLGGNKEDEAVEILEKYTQDIPAEVKGYKKDDPADFCAAKFKELAEKLNTYHIPNSIKKEFKAEKPYSFDTITGKIIVDYAKCEKCFSKACVKACEASILKLNDNENPVLSIGKEEAKKGKCTECLACELACDFEGNKGLYIDLPIPGLDEYRKKNS